MIVCLGFMIGNLAIDFDHFPGIFKLKRFQAFDCLINPYCKPAYVGTPLHKWWFVVIFLALTILSYLYSPNPLLTFFLMGMTLGLITHIMADGYWYPHFQRWFQDADNFKQTILGVN